MKFAQFLSLKNLSGKPGRTTGLVLLSAFLALSIFGGSLVVLSLRRGLDSYSARLGADIVVVPTQARSHGTLESILLQGIPGYFYMDSAYLDKVAAREGVAAVSPQFFLASASAGCCSVAVQVIGFDPETDFSIQPWIRDSYRGSVGDGDLIVGSGITVPGDRKLTFYNLECDVVAQLDETGTGLDNAVYANMSTIRAMMESSVKQGFRYYDGDPQRAISSIFVRVEDGYDIEQVANDINIHVRKVEASQAKRMISEIAAGLDGVSRVIAGLTVLIWLLSVGILIVAFAMMANERKKEFAVLRVLGASERMVSRMLWTESALISLVGGLLGVALACLALFPFRSLIRNALDLPYLLPQAGTVTALIVGAVLVSVAAGSLSSALAAGRITRIETGMLLREGA